MRNLIVIAVLITSPAAAQFTTCNTYGNQTNCNTIQPVQPSAPTPNPMLDNLLNSGRSAGEAAAQGQRNWQRQQCMAMAQRASNAGDNASAAAILRNC